MTHETEPRIWSGITDALPDEHPSAFTTLYCATCREMVHAGNNENMQAWVETGKGPFCLPCFVEAVKEVTPAGAYPLRTGGRTPATDQTAYGMDEGEGWGL